jgi:hypothetical protein
MTTPARGVYVVYEMEDDEPHFYGAFLTEADAGARIDALIREVSEGPAPDGRGSGGGSPFGDVEDRFQCAFVEFGHRG